MKVPAFLRIFLGPGAFKLAAIMLAAAMAGIILFQGATDILRFALPSLKKFIAVKGDYTAFRHHSALADIAIAARQQIPLGSCVKDSINPDQPVLLPITFKYHLFPVKVHDHWKTPFNRSPPPCQGEYFIDLQPKDELSSEQGSSVVRLPHGASLMVKDPGASRPIYRQGREDVVPWEFMIFNSCVIMIGFCFLCYAYPAIRNMSLAMQFSVSFLAGYTCVTTIFWVLALVGIPLHMWLVRGFVAVGFLANLVFLRSGKTCMPATTQKPLTMIRLIHVIRLLSWGGISVLLIMIMAYPLGICDEFNIWLLKAKMFYFHHGITLDYTEFDTNYYPVFWPLYISLHYIAYNGMYDQVAKWTSALFFFCSLIHIRAMARFLGLNEIGAWITVIIFIFFFNHWTFFTALPENLYIALALCATYFFLKWAKDHSENKALYVSSIALVGICGSKFEGFIMIPALFAAYILVYRRSSVAAFKSSWKYLILLLCAGLIPLLWFQWLNAGHTYYEVFHLQNSFSMANFPALFNMIVSIMMTSQTSLIILLFFMTMFMTLNRTGSQETSFLFILSVLLLLFACIAGIRWPPENFRLYYPEVFTRLCSRAMPFFTLFWVSRVFASWPYMRDPDNTKGAA